VSEFDKRKTVEEAKYALDQELRFKANARRNKLLGLWAAEKLGKTGDAAAAYATISGILMAGLEAAMFWGSTSGLAGALRSRLPPILFWARSDRGGRTGAAGLLAADGEDSVFAGLFGLEEGLVCSADQFVAVGGVPGVGG
jgi:hypothetical protein